jgi:hypothetical protein
VLALVQPGTQLGNGQLASREQGEGV